MSTDLTTTTQDQDSTASAAVMFNPGHMQALISFAEMMSKSTVTVPDHLKGKPADCMAIAMQATQWGMNPFAVAQKTHIVSGRLGYEAQLVNAVVQQSRAISGSFRYEFKGDGQGLECRVGAVLRGDADVTWGEWLRNGDVTTKNSPLWKVNPKQQLGYLQVKNWARLYCPGAILGVYTDDELAQVAPPPAHKHMGAADVVQADAPGLPAYPEADFDKYLPAWAKLVHDGKKTAPDLLATLSTKATFTEQQKARVLSLKVAAPVQAEAPAAERGDAPADDWSTEYEAVEGAQ